MASTGENRDASHDIAIFLVCRIALECLGSAFCFDWMENLTDSYKTIEGMAQAEYEEKKSRFIAQVCHVETEDEAVGFLESVRAANPLARHNVYAYVLREGNRTRYSDDGEPARTSGLPTLSVIEHEGLKDVICVTTRYFGGTLLGTGGLVRAYTKAAQDAFAAARKVVQAECVDLFVQVAYPLYDAVSHWACEQGIQVISVDYAENVKLVLRTLASEAQAACVALRDLTHGQAQVEMSEPKFSPLEC